MTLTIAQLLGGIGIFLLGMTLMTDGIKSLAGDSLKTALSKFTGGKIKAIASGAGVTMVIQSSSATTLTTIGFVSAGLLTFQQAIGIIFGANLGTTSTGWLVSLLGIKYSITILALPLIGIGALMSLSHKTKQHMQGMMLSGFGLIFVGIDFLQQSMAVASGWIDPSVINSSGFLARLLIVIVGLVMTVIMQSSSAAMATTIAALHAGAITFEQAALLSIGQNVGTTLTAWIAAIGASIAAKRTAIAHIGFNVLTAVFAFLLLPFFLKLADVMADLIDDHDPTLILASFHTIFNLTGIIILTPFISHFAAYIEKLIPEKKDDITRHLDETLLHTPILAIVAVRNALIQLLHEYLKRTEALLRKEKVDESSNFMEVLIRLKEFLAKVSATMEQANVVEKHVSLLHVMDHVESIIEAEPFLAQWTKSFNVNEEHEAKLEEIQSTVIECRQWLLNDALDANFVGVLQERSRLMAAFRKSKRDELIGHSATGKIKPAQTLQIIDAYKGFDGLIYHIWRAGNHIHLSD